MDLTTSESKPHNNMGKSNVHTKNMPKIPTIYPKNVPSQYGRTYVSNQRTLCYHSQDETEFDWESVALYSPGRVPILSSQRVPRILKHLTVLPESAVVPVSCRMEWFAK